MADVAAADDVVVLPNTLPLVLSPPAPALERVPRASAWLTSIDSADAKRPGVLWVRGQQGFHPDTNRAQFVEIDTVTLAYLSGRNLAVTGSYDTLEAGMTDDDDAVPDGDFFHVHEFRLSGRPEQVPALVARFGTLPVPSLGMSFEVFKERFLADAAARPAPQAFQMLAAPPSPPPSSAVAAAVAAAAAEHAAPRPARSAHKLRGRRT